jgi:hypothetical protein
MSVPFRLAAALAVAVSFAALVARSRPIAGLDGVEPLLAAAGLHQPRGLAFTVDGVLYVAEAGVAGPGGAAVPGRISRLDESRQPTVLVEPAPPASSAQPLFAQSGPGALARPATGGGGAAYVFSGPIADAPLGRVERLTEADGQWRLEPILRLGAGLAEVPGAGGSPGPAAAWGAAVDRAGMIYATLPLANQLLRIDPVGPGGATVATVTGFIGAGQRNPMPVGVAIAPDGALYVALFGTEPFRPGGGRIVRVEPDGRWQPVFEALTLPIAVAFAPDGWLFALEFASGYDARTQQFAPRSGRLLAVGPGPGRRRTVVREINYPTALAFSPAGDVYFTEAGAFSAAGDGRVLRVAAQTLRTFR